MTDIPGDDEAALLKQIDELELPADESRLEDILRRSRACTAAASPALREKLTLAYRALAGQVHLDATAGRFSPPEDGWTWALDLWMTVQMLSPGDADVDRLVGECRSHLAGDRLIGAG